MAQRVKPNLDQTFDIVSFDLQDTEGLSRTLQNLEKIQKQYNSVSGIMEEKVKQQQQVIAQLIERIKMCKRKIIALNNINVAMKFQSPAKFPKKYKFKYKNKKTIFSQLERPTWNEVLYSEEYKPKVICLDKVEGKHPEIHRDEIPQMVQLMYSKFKPRRRNLFEGQNAITKKIRTQHQNMGEVPRNLKYADNLLVFNTQINPYKHYVPINNLKVAKSRQQEQPKQKQDDNRIDLYEAPTTLAENERATQYQAQDAYYKPEFKAIPQMQFDTGLGDVLGGVVSLDMTSQQQDQFQLAPSRGGVIMKTTLQDPSNPQQSLQQTQVQQNAVQQLQSGSLNQTPQQNNIQQQQQPQQSTNLVQQPQTMQGPPPIGNVVQTQPQSGGPPPLNSIMSTNNNNNSGPPPLNSLVPSSQPTQQAAVQKAPAPPAPSGGGGRSDLLEEIRNPKIKLRKRVTKETTALGAKKKSIDISDKAAPNAGGGSIMDQLQRQIALRYKALHPEEDKKKSKPKKVVGGNSDDDDDDDDEESD